MASGPPSSSIDRLHQIPDQVLDPADHFRSFLEIDRNLPGSLSGPRNTECWYRTWDGPLDPNDRLNLKNADCLHRFGSDEYNGGIIIFREIDVRAIRMLLQTFPHLDLHFLHQHAARSEMPHTSESGPILVRQLSSQMEDSDSPAGLHFDGYCSPLATQAEQDNTGGSSIGPLAFTRKGQVWAGQKYRTDVFVKRDLAWYRASTRISCCMLRPGLYLVLIDSPLSIPSVNKRETVKNSTYPALAKNPKDTQEWSFFDAYGTLTRTFEAFSPREVLKLMSIKVPPTVKSDSTFHCLLVVSDWQFLVDDLEREIRNLQSRATESLDKKTLTDMTSSRRQIADARENIADNEAQMLLATGMATKKNIGGLKSQNHRNVQYFFNDVTVTTGGVFSTHLGNDQVDTEEIEPAMLLDKLAQLEDRLGIVAKTVNEEVQLFIASVSLRDSEVMLADSKIMREDSQVMREDSQVMREDSQIMKQQAARTTLLTTLAVIYLPLQLITGIFGMNIKEITGDGKPRWWACLAALGAGAILTFLVYLAVKWWPWRMSQQKAREAEKEKDA